MLMVPPPPLPQQLSPPAPPPPPLLLLLLTCVMFAVASSRTKFDWYTVKPYDHQRSKLSCKANCVVLLVCEFILLEYNVTTIFLWQSVQLENRRCKFYSQPVVNKTTNNKLVIRHGWLGLIQTVAVVLHCTANLLCSPDGKCVCRHYLSVLLYNSSRKLLQGVLCGTG